MVDIHFASNILKAGCFCNIKLRKDGGWSRCLTNILSLWGITRSGNHSNSRQVRWRRAACGESGVGFQRARRIFPSLISWIRSWSWGGAGSRSSPQAAETSPRPKRDGWCSLIAPPFMISYSFFFLVYLFLFHDLLLFMFVWSLIIPGPYVFSCVWSFAWSDHYWVMYILYRSHFLISLN